LYTCVCEKTKVGEATAKRKGGGNPYAKLISASKIEQVACHKSSAISKRASQIWKEHVVVCAICNISFPKKSDEAKFCAECKCHVCHKVYFIVCVFSNTYRSCLLHVFM
jgi:hypothetical protein